MAAIKIAVVGMGKIARDQHLPSIAGNADFEFVASVSPRDPGVEGVANFTSLESLLADGPAIDAIALCTPPQVRYELASMALAKRVHVFLEKPPGATLAALCGLPAHSISVIRSARNHNSTAPSSISGMASSPLAFDR